MSWAWVRPADPRVLEGRPLLDLGTGDGQTLATLVEGIGLVVGADRANEVLPAARSGGFPLVQAEAVELPFRNGTFEVVLAGDLLHHLNELELERVLAETRRVLRPRGRLVAWWYASHGRDAPNAPRYPRTFDEFAGAAKGFTVNRLELELTLEPAPPTVGIVARV